MCLHESPFGPAAECEDGLAEFSDAEIDAAARAGGMVNMYETGAAKVWRGETTIDEVLRATRMG